MRSKLSKGFAYFENKTITYFILCVAVFSFALLFGYCRDLDLFWHLKIGEQIVRTGEVSLLDSFSWQEGLLWCQQEWLFDLLIYLFCLPSKYLFEVLFVLNSTMMILYGMRKSLPSCKIAYLIFALITFFLVPANHGNRPSEFSVWFVFGFLCLLMKQWAIGKKLFLSLVLGVVIANFHGACLLPVLGFSGCLVLAELVLIFRKISTYRKLFRLFLSVFAFFIGTLVNPNGIYLFYHLAGVTGASTTTYITEWAKWVPGLFGCLLIIAFLGSVFYSFSSIFEDESAFRFFVVWLAALVLTFMYGGKGGIFFLFFSLCFVYPYLARLILYLIPCIGCVRQYVFIIFVSILVAYTAIFRTDYISFFDKGDAYLPKAVVDTLRVAYEEDYDGSFSVFNSYLTGDLLIWNDIPCFIDSRQLPYISELSSVSSAGNQSVDDYFEVYYASGFSQKEMYDKFFAKYHFDYVLETSEFLLEDYLCTTDYQLLMEVISADGDVVRLWKKGK